VKSRPGAPLRGRTLLLDEIGDLPFRSSQAAALSSGREYERSATAHPPADVRILPPPNVNLNGRPRRAVREDLFYRLNVISHPHPPLRERPADIAQADGPIVLFAATIAHLRFTDRGQVRLSRYAWPGQRPLAQQMQSRGRSSFRVPDRIGPKDWG